MSCFELFRVLEINEEKHSIYIMITTFADYNQNAPIQLTLEQQAVIDVYVESFTPKICRLESY